jgi:hypothetical protein
MSTVRLESGLKSSGRKGQPQGAAAKRGSPGAFLEELLQFGRLDPDEGIRGQRWRRRDVRVEAVGRRGGVLQETTIVINSLHCFAPGAGWGCVLLLLGRVRQRAKRQRLLFYVQRLRQRQRASLRRRHP